MDALRSVLGPEVAGIMLTMPTTLGLFDPKTAEICELVHEAGGLVYGDGANLNALLGRARLGDMASTSSISTFTRRFRRRTAAAGRARGRSASRSTWRSSCRRRTSNNALTVYTTSPRRRSRWVASGRRLETSGCCCGHTRTSGCTGRTG